MPAYRLVAIHQPNFFPWLGYFNKISRADVIIVMDNAQFQKGSKGTWSNRVKLVVNGQAAWVTMPIVRSYRGVRFYREMRSDNSIPWRSKVLKTIRLNYSRAPFFNEVFSLLEDLLNNPTNDLTDYNLRSILGISESIGLETSKIVLGSTLHTTGRATDLLISMTRAVGGTAYLCGGGASGYQEDEKFAAAGLELIYQRFQHPEYPQLNTDVFIPGLSIIDTLMNCGYAETRILVSRQARSQATRRTDSDG